MSQPPSCGEWAGCRGRWCASHETLPRPSPLRAGKAALNRPLGRALRRFLGRKVGTMIENGETVASGPEAASPGLRGAPDPARVRAWLDRHSGFENARVDAVDPLTDGLSNVTCQLSLTNAPVASAVLRVQPKEGIFEPYDIMREAAVLRCLSGTSVPVPRVLATDSDTSFFGAPCLLMEWIDAPHMPAPEVDPTGFAADLAPFAQALASVHALDWRAAGLGFL